MTTTTKEQIFKNFDYTNTSAWLTVQAYADVLGQPFNPDDPSQRNSPAQRGPWPSDDWGQARRLVDFDLRAHPEIEPIKRQITHMSRFKVFEPDKNGRMSSKEVLTVMGRFRAVDYLGDELSTTYHEGWFKKPSVRIVPRDRSNPEKKNKYGELELEKKITGFTYEYTIQVPNEVKARRELIDSIIDRSPFSYKENILFQYKDMQQSNMVTGPHSNPRRSSVYSYDQFYRCDLTELHRLLYNRYGPDGKQPYFDQQSGKWLDEHNNVVDQTNKGLYK